MKIIALILKSGVHFEVDPETVVDVVYTEHSDLWEEGRNYDQNNIKKDLTRHLKVFREEHFRFSSKGKVWMVKESEIAAISYEKEEEKPLYTGVKTI